MGFFPVSEWKKFTWGYNLEVFLDFDFCLESFYKLLYKDITYVHLGLFFFLVGHYL